MRDRRKRSTCLIAATGLVIIAFIACGIATARFLGWQPRLFRSGPALQKSPYLETFDTAETWMAGEGATAQGEIDDGVYKMALDASNFDDQFWAAGGRNFADAVYEVEATPLEGATDNGYGMLFRVDADRDRFYLFKVSSDGYAMIALCTDGCAEQEILFDIDWFGSQAIDQGFNVTNTLRVIAKGPEMSFFVNDIEVGQAVEETLKNGDIGLYAETFAPGGLIISFDNFRVTPIEAD